jgi:putative tricarboxylic transport membrane protein
MPGGSGSVAIAHVVEKRKGDTNLIVAASNSLTFSMAIGVVPTDMVYVPFQGGGEAITALLGGHVDVAALDISEIAGQLEAGKVRMLGVMSEKRLKGFPNLPTLTEQGVDLVFPVWRGVYMAPDVPADAVAYWTDIFQKMLASDEWVTEAQKLGWEPVTRIGDDFVAYVNDEDARYEDLLKELGFAK